MSTPELVPFDRAAPVLPTGRLAADEAELVAGLSTDIRAAEPRCRLLDAYYDSVQTIDNLGISVPPELEGLHTVIGWPGVYTDALEERLDVEGFRYPDDAAGDDELWDLWQTSNMDEESQLAHLDALIYGRSYIAVGAPDPGSDTPVLTVESPRDMAVKWNPRRRVVEAALRLYEVDREPMATLYLPEQTVYLTGSRGGWVVAERDEHRLGAVPVVRMSNRQRSSDRTGSTEITRAIRSITDSCCRTLLGVEVAREFYSAPQRWVVGAAPDQFVDTATGKPLAGWEAYLGRVMALGVNEEGGTPQVGTFAQYSPEAYTKVIDTYAHIMASQTGLPLAYLGIATDQPASADAIRMQEQRHVKKAERKQRIFGGGWEQAIRLALRMRDGGLDERAQRMTTLWRDAATPTLAAQADATVKLITAGVLPATSSVAMDMVGLSVGQQQRLTAERESAAGDEALAALLATPEPTPQPTPQPQQQAGVPEQPTATP